MAKIFMDKLRVCIFHPIVGIPSEVWVSRQAEGFVRCDLHLLTWEFATNASWEFSGSVHRIGEPWTKERKLMGRIAYRLGISECRSQREENAIGRILEKVEPNIALCHFGWTADRALEAFRDRKIPFAVIFHGSDLASRKLRGSYKRRIFKVLRSAKAIIIVGSHMKEILYRIDPGLKSDKVHVIPCGAPLARFGKSPITRRDKDGALRLISVGRLVREKGIDLILRAIASGGWGPDKVRLTIVGDGICRQKFQTLVCELGLEDSVKFMGFVKQDRVADLLSSHHVLVQPSRRSAWGWVEGFGVSITEAMASGLPVIASRSGGIPDQVRNKKEGLLVDEGDVGAIRSNLEILKNDEALRLKMAAAARVRAREFDSESLAAQVEELLYFLAGQHG